jgi:hypothetical protein
LTKSATDDNLAETIEEIMSKTIAVVRGDKKNEVKILVNYIQRGITFHSIKLANAQAVELSKKEPCDHLILMEEI